eukprot:Tbor_TRINITY_DN655_c0_g1::TRINITY_DN655_c0_g1_i1::g.1619::m.1619/K01883/CARS, cysS; cysteinyl-tRNA synthetase
MSYSNAPSVQLPEGISREGIKRDKHPLWFPPTGGSADVGLKVFNSLTETLEPFTPRKGRQVTWYTCGPTVYDHSHMGHARAYLTFDILRRIMEDYFGYSVQYQINITDIDDKIIKRARVNKLIADYKAEVSGDINVLKTFVDEAVSFTEISMKNKLHKLQKPLEQGASSRLKAEHEEKLKELELKMAQFSETKASIQAASDFEALFAAGNDVMGELLDEKRGSTISGTEIFEAHARKFEQSFFNDMRRLGVRDPDILTRVTEYVPEIVSFVQKIIDNGFAYITNNSVLFDTDAYIKAGHSYPKLKAGGEKASEEEMAEGEGVLSKGQEGGKKNPSDFALWKFSKTGEPSWESPWGPGRPGWHIECSVVASDIFGANMDIHAGGCDLKFPHHDNECAQSEAYHQNGQWVNYFLHCGHLHIKGLKMSKSLKNFITIQHALDNFASARQIRLLFLSNDWTRPMNFSEQTLGEAKEVERILRSFFGTVEALLRGDNMKGCQKLNDHDRNLHSVWVETERQVHEALSDNFNTVVAMNQLMALVSQANMYFTTERQLPMLVRKVAVYVTKILRVFGVVQGTDEIGLDNAGSSSSGDEKHIPVVNALVQLRDNVRWAARDNKPASDILSFCDRVRDELLPPTGIRLEDKPSGEPTLWKTDDPAILMKEIADRKIAAESDRKKKLKNQYDTKSKEYAKFLKFQKAPKEYFLEMTDKYSEFDIETGIPSKDAKGDAISDKVKGKLEKELCKYSATHEEIMNNERGGQKYSKLKSEMDYIQIQLGE